MKKIIVASKNPSKIKAVDIACRQVFGKNTYFIEGFGANSGVSDQPFGEVETYQGALNRAKDAQKNISNADFWIGLEGGLIKQFDTLQAFAWMVVLDKNKVGQARTASFILPKAIADLIAQGYELGEADDIVFKRKNSKHKDGAVGILTQGLIDRANYYAPAITLAFIPFMKENQDLF